MVSNGRAVVATNGAVNASVNNKASSGTVALRGKGGWVILRVAPAKRDRGIISQNYYTMPTSKEAAVGARFEVRMFVKGARAAEVTEEAGGSLNDGNS